MAQRYTSVAQAFAKCDTLSDFAIDATALYTLFASSGADVVNCTSRRCA